MGRKKKNTRPWVKLSALKVGDHIQCDGGFDCMKPGRTFEVKEGDGRLYVACIHGFHALEGQLDDDDRLIGFYKA